jgi:type I restriction enzyme M protein
MTHTSTKSKNSATIGFEATLWQVADKLRSSMDAAEYKHVVLGLIFLKYISDTFASHQALLEAGLGEFADADPEDRDEYLAYNVFWVPKEARDNLDKQRIGELIAIR